MVKIAGPLLSVNAHGKLAQTLSYQKRKEGNIGRQYHYPHKTISQKQYTRRTILGLLTAHWQCMTDAQKLVWENNAKSTALNISGFNYFVKEAMADLKTHHGLCGYWSFNELTGATVLDYSGQGNTGTLKPTYPSNVPSRADGQNEKFGKALSFDGNDDYVDCGNDTSLDITDEITMEAWSKPASGSGHLGIIGTHGHVTAYGMYFRRQAGADIGMAFNDNGTFINSTWGTVLYNTWNNVVGTYKAGHLKTYLNGILVGDSTGTNSGARNFEGVYLGYITSIAQPQFFKGLIDEVRLYNRELSGAEIMKHYELLRQPNRRQIRLV